MSNWTRFDPGAGDTASCNAAKQWMDTQAADLLDAEQEVSTMLRDLDDTWTGESADAFRVRTEEFQKRLKDSAEAMQTAGKAIVGYGDQVAEIARKAEPLNRSLESAELILNGFFSDQLFGTDPEGITNRQEAERKATEDAAAAADALVALAQDRMKTDQTLATILARTASETWGGLDCAAAPEVGISRDLANDQVRDLLDDFITGNGERGIVLGIDDPFVRTLMGSEHIDSTRERVLEDLRSGKLVDGGEPLNNNRVISDNPSVLVNDGFNILTSPFTGTFSDAVFSDQNLPESFLGSYNLEVSAGEPQADGGVPVTYVILNDTTIDSATRIPGTGGGHVPLIYGKMTEANAENGNFAPQRQTIVWTETVYP
ncbi:putative T7SS-secreted protein [Microbacterium sp. NPDC076768]|uniref:WXG100 family type VII secretion target n=1 Tax=Microbacterium sp. NPDC076768 TaxID=3154858 RepID=UPI00342D2F84